MADGICWALRHTALLARAQHFMKLKLRPSPHQGVVKSIYRQVEAARLKQDFQQVIELLERASRLDTANPSILLQLGGAHGQYHFDYGAAEQCFERALRVSPHPTETMASIGKQSSHFRFPDLAERYLKRAIEQKDATAETFAELAELYERNRRIEEASALIERALRLKPGCAEAVLAQARIERQGGRLDTAEKLLSSFPANADNSTRARAWYELGNVLDRQGRYAEAMNAFHKAKWLLRLDAEQRARDLKVTRTRMDALVANASSDVLKQWFDGLPQLPPARRLALLGGHPRSGTTLLEQLLDSHPDIVSVEESEVFLNHAFTPLLRSAASPDTRSEPDVFCALASATVPQLQRSRADYFHAMGLALGRTIEGPLLIDKNPSLTFLAPALIRVFPEIKFLVALRDPRDVVLSCFMQYLPPNQVGAAFLYLESTVTEYTTLMAMWQKMASRMSNPYLQVRYEDMVDDLEAVARKTLDFLGVTWDDKVLAFHEHAQKKVVRSPTYADVTQPVYKRARGRWRNYQKDLEPYLPKLEPFVKAFGYE